MATEKKDYMAEVGDLSGQVTYKPSAEVQAANGYLRDVANGKPADYNDKYADQLGGLYDQIMNRGTFNYDLNGDELYRQYRDIYQKNGIQAKNETLGQISGMTGGYGNTYGAIAGTQQYGEYLKRMNDVLPGLYNNAANAYAAEGDRLTNLYGMAQNASDREYGRYQDQMADWRDERQYAQQAAANAYQRDYKQYSDAMNTGMNVLGMERADTKENHDYAYKWALSMIQMGVVPSDGVLDTAGISKPDAKTLAAKYASMMSGGGGGRRRRRGSGSGGGTDTGLVYDMNQGYMRRLTNYDQSTRTAGPGRTNSVAGSLNRAASVPRVSTASVAAAAKAASKIVNKK